MDFFFSLFSFGRLSIVCYLKLFTNDAGCLNLLSFRCAMSKVLLPMKRWENVGNHSTTRIGSQCRKKKRMEKLSEGKAYWCRKWNFSTAKTKLEWLKVESESDSESESKWKSIVKYRNFFLETMWWPMWIQTWSFTLQTYCIHVCHNENYITLMHLFAPHHTAPPLSYGFIIRISSQCFRYKNLACTTTFGKLESQRHSQLCSRPTVWCLHIRTCAHQFETFVIGSCLICCAKYVSVWKKDRISYFSCDMGSKTVKL